MPHAKKIILAALLPFCFFLQNAAAHEGHDHTEADQQMAHAHKENKENKTAENCPCHPQQAQDSAAPMVKDTTKKANY